MANLFSIFFYLLLEYPNFLIDCPKCKSTFSNMGSNAPTCIYIVPIFENRLKIKTRSYVSWYKYAVKAKRNKGMKNAGHGLNRGRRYWCHASDSLTEPSGSAASQQAHIPISLHYERKLRFIAERNRDVCLLACSWP